MPRKTTRRPALCVAILLMAAGLARAQDAQPEPNPHQPRIYGAAGYYLGVSGVYALGITDLPGVGDVEESWGASLRVGHRFNRWLASEVHFEWLNDFAYEGGGFTAWDLMLSERLYVIEGRLQPFAVVGLGVMEKRDHGGGSSRRGYGFGGRFGAGIDVYANDDLSVTVDGAYVVPFTHIEDYDFVAVSVGVQWW